MFEQRRQSEERVTVRCLCVDTLRRTCTDPSTRGDEHCTVRGARSVSSRLSMVRAGEWSRWTWVGASQATYTCHVAREMQRAKCSMILRIPSRTQRVPRWKIWWSWEHRDTRNCWRRGSSRLAVVTSRGTCWIKLSLDKCTKLYTQGDAINMQNLATTLRNER